MPRRGRGGRKGGRHRGNRYNRKKSNHKKQNRSRQSQNGPSRIPKVNLNWGEADGTSDGTKQGSASDERGPLLTLTVPPEPEVRLHPVNINYAYCEFKEIRRRHWLQEDREIVENVIKMSSDEIKINKCRLAAFGNPFLKETYYFAVWQGQVRSQDAPLVRAGYGGIFKNVQVFIAAADKFELPVHDDHSWQCDPNDVVTLGSTPLRYYEDVLRANSIDIPWTRAG